ncbi:MAG: exo-beta-N-acetylmuramidase NamZ family protein [Bacteroidota bacterium]
MRKYTSFFNRRNVMKYTRLLLFPAVFIIACGSEVVADNKKAEKDQDEYRDTAKSVTGRGPDSRINRLEFNRNIITGAQRTEEYLKLLEGKKVAVTANQTSLVGNTHLVDTLKALGINITKIFALEHGFRGNVQAGEHIKNGKDAKTGIPVVSLYGNSKKPKPEMLKDVDVIVFDIQDVGARFYTYISSMHYIMEAAAENKKTFIVLDRPNPNGFYVDGPVLEEKNKSFVGMHPVPVVHGMTIGEYAQMINGEGWLKNKAKCELTVIACTNYKHSDLYELPVKPSPNLPNSDAVLLYPSLCLFEGTTVSIARGTDFPFQAIGIPGFAKGDFTFTPKSVEAAKNPPHKDVECSGYDLRGKGLESAQKKQLNLSWLLDFYNNCPDKKTFFETDGMFRLLAGTENLKKQIEEGKTEEEIRETWKEGLEKFKKVREKYLIYEE